MAGLSEDRGQPALSLPAAEQTGPHADAFASAVRAIGRDPADRWIGGYAAYEWSHLRPLLAAYGVDVAGRDLLEFGCNVGGSSVVLSALGARLTGVDVDAAMVAIADANLARHALPGDLVHVADTRSMPFADHGFDLILANSVLEYVDPAHLPAVIDEFHRLLRPGGRLLICGTASRLVPREVHSRRWLVNYWPRGLDRVTGRAPQRGLSPLLLARLLRGRFVDDSGGGWRDARVRIHGRAGPLTRAFAALGAVTRRSPGWLAPSIEVSLRRA